MKRLGLLACLALIGATASGPTPVVIPVTVAPGLGDHFSGRLIVFAQKEEPGAKPAAEIDFSPFRPTGASIAAREVTDIGPGAVAQIDGETDAFPASFSTLPPGTYRFQAVLDRNHDYNYAGRDAGDLVSRVVEVTLPGKLPAIALDSIVPASDPAAALDRLPLGRGARAVATLLFAAPEAQVLIDPLRAALAGAEGLAGASAWNGLLVARFAAADSAVLRRDLISALGVLRAGRPLPRVWQC